MLEGVVRGEALLEKNRVTTSEKLNRESYTSFQRHHDRNPKIIIYLFECYKEFDTAGINFSLRLRS